MTLAMATEKAYLARTYRGSEQKSVSATVERNLEYSIESKRLAEGRSTGRSGVRDESIAFSFVGPVLKATTGRWEMRWVVEADSIADAWIGLGSDDNGMLIRHLPAGNSPVSQITDQSGNPIHSYDPRYGVKGLPWLDRGAVLVNAWSGVVAQPKEGNMPKQKSLATNVHKTVPAPKQFTKATVRVVYEKRVGKPSVVRVGIKSQDGVAASTSFKSNSKSVSGTKRLRFED